MQEKKIAENIKHYRKISGYTQAEISQKLFVTQQAYSRWENGEVVPGGDRIEDLAGVLGISPLFFYDTEPVFRYSINLDKDLFKEKALAFLIAQKDNPRQKKKMLINACVSYYEDMPDSGAEIKILLTADEFVQYETYFQDRGPQDKLSFYKRIRPEEYGLYAYGIELLYDFMQAEMKDDAYLDVLSEYRKKVRTGTWLSKHMNQYDQFKLRQGVLP